MTDNLILCSCFGITIQNDFKGVRDITWLCSFKRKNEKQESSFLTHDFTISSDHKCLDQNILIPNQGHAGCQEINEINHLITFLFLWGSQLHANQA